MDLASESGLLSSPPPYLAVAVVANGCGCGVWFHERRTQRLSGGDLHVSSAWEGGGETW